MLSFLQKFSHRFPHSTQTQQEQFMSVGWLSLTERAKSFLLGLQQSKPVQLRGHGEVMLATVKSH